MPAGNTSTLAKPGSRLRELGLVLAEPPLPLGAYVEASQAGALLLSGTLPLVNRAARFGVTGSARAQSNRTTPADLRAIKVQQMALVAIRLPII